MRHKSVLHVKRTRAKGRSYYYFRTGQAGPNGKEVLVRLPDLADPGFGASYASCLAGRSRRENAPPELTVPGLIALYEASDQFRKKLAPGSQKIYRISLTYFAKMLPTAPAALLERSDIARLIDGRADQPGAANSLLRTINALYKWARVRGHVTNNPGKDVPTLDVGEHDPWPDHILSAALASDDMRVRLSAHLLFYTGQRLGDVVKMKWTDIRKDADGCDILYVMPEKTRNSSKIELDIPIHADLLAELARYPKGLGYIIPGAKPGKPIHQHSVREALQDFARERGVEVVPHGLRKNAVNALLEAGCSVGETASISGQSLKMVEHYAKGRAQGRMAKAAILKWQNKA